MKLVACTFNGRYLECLNTSVASDDIKMLLKTRRIMRSLAYKKYLSSNK